MIFILQYFCSFSFSHHVCTIFLKIVPKLNKILNFITLSVSIQRKKYWIYGMLSQYIQGYTFYNKILIRLKYTFLTYCFCTHTVFSPFVSIYSWKHFHLPFNSAKYLIILCCCYWRGKAKHSVSNI